MTYGALTNDDIGVLEAVMWLYRDGLMRFLEIGVHTGTTARGIRDFCQANKITLEYWGLDSGVQNDGKPPFEGAKMVVGDSAECAHLLPPVLDIVLCDGCHCFNHVILDTVLYGEKVITGGFILHHDTAPQIQQTMRDPHGPPTPRFHNSVVDALRAIHFPFPDWSLYLEACDGLAPSGGMSAHQKIR